MFALSAIHSPIGLPTLGPMFALATKSAIGWPALSASPKRSAIVPATLDKAVLPAAPARNWNIMSIGRFRARAVPWHESACLA